MKKTNLEYKGKKWDKEVSNFQKNIKTINNQFNKNEIADINEFEKNGRKNFLRLYYGLSGTYRLMIDYYYLYNLQSIEVIKYAILSGYSALIAKKLYLKGVREGYVNEHLATEIDYKIFCLIAASEPISQFKDITEDNLIMLMYQQKYEEAEKILRDLPDNPKGEGCEWYYYDPSYLKPIYMAIINHDEKGFNAGLEKRIKKYRTNMVGYSVKVDIVSVGLIKMAKKAGINCTVDVIEIPKQFFSEEKLIDTNECKLPYFDDLLKSGLLQ